MAQLSSNSQGTLGIESGGTQSALLHLVRDAGAYAIMLARALRELEWRRARPVKQAQIEQSDEPRASKVDIRQENDPFLLKEKSAAQLAGTEQKKLAPGPEGEQSSMLPLTPEDIGISPKKNLMVEIQIGNYYLKDSYPKLPQYFDKMPIPQRQALEIAMTGGTPPENVSIRVKDEFGNQAEFLADKEINSGWIVPDELSKTMSTQAIKQDLQRNKAAGVQKIRNTMRALKPEGGPDMFRGQSLTVLTDGDEVIVVDQHTGIIRDAERLDKIGNLGEQAVREAAREAAGAFGVAGGAGQGITQPNKQKQRELTP
ncbi:MAG: hypothetical protein AB8B99_17685 [Phormidesmis sp.]